MSQARAGMGELLSFADELKVVFTDLDGTLLGADSSLPPGLDGIASRLRATGVRLVPTTGRTLPSVSHLLGGALALEDCVAANGMDVICEGQALRHVDYERELCTRLLQRSLRSDPPMGMVAYGPERPVLIGLDPSFFESRGARINERVPFAPAHDLPDAQIVKISVVTQLDASEVVCDLADEFAGELDFAVCGPWWIDVVPSGVSKADGVRLVMDRLGAQPAQAMAFGDSMNDAAMMPLVGASVAVANAMDELKAICRFEVGHHAEGGVLRALDSIARRREELLGI